LEDLEGGDALAVCKLPERDVQAPKAEAEVQQKPGAVYFAE
jgi:hypothetical protein